MHINEIRKQAYQSKMPTKSEQLKVLEMQLNRLELNRKALDNQINSLKLKIKAVSGHGNI